ncbi:DUF4113 domain-containing protein [Pseudomonas sp. JUb96]|uniref:DUF4113 domain-containing protein n=1 Tax=Pseudomonas sp. JUb96 TaxID=2940539 RepID=UPI0039B40542
MTVLDQINERWGRGTLRAASVPVSPDWGMRGLRGEIDRLSNTRSATCSAVATQQRQAGGSVVVVLGRLLDESDRMAGSLAEAFARSRIAGRAFEAAYAVLVK